MTNASLAFKDKEFFKQILTLWITNNTIDVAERLRNKLPVSAALAHSTVIVVHKLFLRLNNVHGSLRKDRFHDVIKRNCSFNRYLQTHSNIDAK